MPPRKRLPKPPKREQIEKDVFFLGDRAEHAVQLLTGIGWTTRYFVDEDEAAGYLEVARAADATGRVVYYRGKTQIEELVDEREWQVCTETVKVLGPLPPAVASVKSI